MSLGALSACCLALAAPAFAVGGPTAGDDVIVGTSGPDHVEALGGDDVVHGYLGNDLLGGGGGDDALYGGRGSDHVFGREGDDLLSGGPRPDDIYGHAGADELRGGAEADTIVPGSGADEVHAGPGDDEIYVYRDGKADRIFCDGGHDWVEIKLKAHQHRDAGDTFVDCEDVYVDRAGEES